MKVDIFNWQENQMKKTKSCINQIYGKSTPVVVDEGKAPIFKSEEELAIENLDKLEQTDIILKGRKPLPIGTRKKYGDVDYVKTSQGWKNNKDVKDAHDKIHGSDELKNIIDTATNKFSGVLKEGKNVAIIKQSNGEYNYRFDNDLKVGDTHANGNKTDSNFLGGKVVHIIQGKSNP